MKKILLIAPLLGAILLISSCGNDDNSSTPAYTEYQSVSIDNGAGRVFNLFSNVNVSTPNGDVSQYVNLLFYCHGGSLDGGNYFKYAKSAIAAAGKTDNTVVVSPQFQTGDVNSNYTWGQYGWKDSDNSTNGTPKISSYTAIDDVLLNNVLKNYPNIENIIIAGHSAGGQFVYRYAALSNIVDLSSHRINFLSMNPSSYCYLNGKRWDDMSKTFAVPSDAGSCSSYDNWPYGLQNLSSNDYNSGATITDVQASLPLKYVTVGVGKDDGGGTDNCQSNYMGDNRYQRGVIIDDFINSEYSNNNHNKIEVEGVDHDGEGMINSSEVATYINTIFK